MKEKNQKLIKKKKDEEKAKPQKSKISYKEKKLKSDKKKQKNKHKSSIYETNNGENISKLEFDDEKISTINGDTSKSEQSDVSDFNIIEDNCDTKENMIIIDNKESDNTANELNEQLRKIIAILYDLLDNIKKKI